MREERVILIYGAFFFGNNANESEIIKTTHNPAPARTLPDQGVLVAKSYTPDTHKPSEGGGKKGARARVL